MKESTRKTRRGRQEESQDGPEVDGTETFPTDVSLTDKVGRKADSEQRRFPPTRRALMCGSAVNEQHARRRKTWGAAKCLGIVFSLGGIRMSLAFVVLLGTNH